MLGELRRASKRGAAIASFNPLRERGLERFADPQDRLEMLRGGSTRISSDYFQLRIGGDLAAVKGLIQHVLEADERSEEHTSELPVTNAPLVCPLLVEKNQTNTPQTSIG